MFGEGRLLRNVEEEVLIDPGGIQRLLAEVGDLLLCPLAGVEQRLAIARGFQVDHDVRICKSAEVRSLDVAGLDNLDQQLMLPRDAGIGGLDLVLGQQPFVLDDLILRHLRSQGDGPGRRPPMPRAELVPAAECARPLHPVLVLKEGVHERLVLVAQGADRLELQLQVPQALPQDFLLLDGRELGRDVKHPLVPLGSNLRGEAGTVALLLHTLRADDVLVEANFLQVDRRVGSHSIPFPLGAHAV
eukprot:scaffold757_cov246-Pinguiococcus_pyrenoidosus.AAC.8